MPLHRQTEAYLAKLTTGRPQPRSPLKVQDMDAKGVPVRVYSPASEEPLPALLYFHGGGFTGGGFYARAKRRPGLGRRARGGGGEAGGRPPPAPPFSAPGAGRG